MKQLIYIIVFLLSANVMTAQLNEVDELIITAKTETTNNGSPGKVLSYWLRAFETIKNQEDKSQMREVCLAIGEIYATEKLYTPALKYYQILLTHIQTNNKPGTEGILGLYQLIGNTYSNLSQPDSAFFFHEKVLTHHEKANNVNAQINTLRDIVKAYTHNEKYGNALENNLQIKDLLERHNKAAEQRLVIYNNLGYNYNFLKQYEEAIEYFSKALELNKEGDRNSKITLYTNIGIAYYNLGEFEESIEYLLAIQKERIEVNQLLANVYLKKQDLYNAKDYSVIAYKKAKRESNAELLSEVCYTAAQVHTELYEYDQALKYFQEHLNLRDSLQFEERFRQENLLRQQASLEQTEEEVKLLIINREIQELNISQLKLESEKQQLALNNLKLEDDRKEKELSLLRKEQEIKEANLQNQKLAAQRTKQELQLTQQKLLNAKKEKDLVGLEQTKQLQLLEIERRDVQLREEQKEKELYKKNNDIQQLELQQQKDFQQFLYGIGGLLGLISLLILGGLFYSRKINKQLNQKNLAIEQQKEEIATERNKSEQLLLNILPAETATELKEKGFATPKQYDNATVVFTDFSGFTKVAAKLKPAELIQELNICFEAFDQILDKYGLEKIKTIGDAYMCVAGIPIPNENNATDAIAAGIEIMAYMKKRSNEKRAGGEEYWDMRMGIHTGAIVAGVIGQRKFAYDIWGDTVNIASRMEENGAIGKINVSEATYELVKHKYNCVARPTIDVHNVGAVKMFFVE